MSTRGASHSTKSALTFPLYSLRCFSKKWPAVAFFGCGEAEPAAAPSSWEVSIASAELDLRAERGLSARPSRKLSATLWPPNVGYRQECQMRLVAEEPHAEKGHHTYFTVWPSGGGQLWL